MPDQHLATRLSALFRTRRCRVYTTDDVTGVEMAGALKNVFALAVGMGYSLGIGENTRALVIAPALREMTKLGRGAGRALRHLPRTAGLGGATSSSPVPASAAATATSANNSAPASRSTRSSPR
jgi:glycerol-3-phosphate dehydrogenase (NAD(P)+)